MKTITTKNNKIIRRFEESDIAIVRQMREVLGYSYAKIAKKLESKAGSVCDFYNHIVRRN
jgi:hypothetical protein